MSLWSSITLPEWSDGGLPAGGLACSQRRQSERVPGSGFCDREQGWHGAGQKVGTDQGPAPLHGLVVPQSAGAQARRGTRRRAHLSPPQNQTLETDHTHTLALSHTHSNSLSALRHRVHWRPWGPACGQLGLSMMHAHERCIREAGLSRPLRHHYLHTLPPSLPFPVSEVSLHRQVVHRWTGASGYGTYRKSDDIVHVL